MPIINIRFNTQANTKESRPRQIATRTTGMTTKNKAKQTLKNFFNVISSYAFFFQQVFQHVPLTLPSKLISAKLNNALLLHYYFWADLPKSINKII